MERATHVSNRVFGVNVLARVVAAMDAIEEGALELAWEILRDLELDIEGLQKRRRAA